MAERGAQKFSTTRKRFLEQPASVPADSDNLPEVLRGDDLAIGFWKKHAEALAANDMLCEQDRETFAVMCQVWATMQREKDNTKLWLELVTKYNAMARGFGMVPADRRRMALTFGDPLSRHGNKDEFNF